MLTLLSPDEVQKHSRLLMTILAGAQPATWRTVPQEVRRAVRRLMGDFADPKAAPGDDGAAGAWVSRLPVPIGKGKPRSAADWAVCWLAGAAQLDVDAWLIVCGACQGDVLGMLKQAASYRPEDWTELGALEVLRELPRCVAGDQVNPFLEEAEAFHQRAMEVLCQVPDNTPGLTHWPNWLFNLWEDAYRSKHQAGDGQAREEAAAGSEVSHTATG